MRDDAIGRAFGQNDAPHALPRRNRLPPSPNDPGSRADRLAYAAGAHGAIADRLTARRYGQADFRVMPAVGGHAALDSYPGVTAFVPHLR